MKPDDRAGRPRRIEAVLEAFARDAAERDARIEAALDALAPRVGRVEEQLAALAASLAGYHPTVQGGRNLNATLIDGLLVAVPAEEIQLALYHAFYGFQEPGVLAVFAALLEPGSVVVDAGACIGAFTLHAARAVGPSGKVYAFEPTPRTFDVLVENLKFNAFNETGVVYPRAVALSERNGTAAINVFEGHFGLNTLYAGGDMPALEVRVTTMRLDDALADVDRVDVVKIDVEGAERAVIAGMPRLLASNPALAIIMEFAPGHLRRAHVDPAPFAHELLQAGFQLQLIDDISGDVGPIDVAELVSREHSNLLMRRPGLTGA